MPEVEYCSTCSRDPAKARTELTVFWCCVCTSVSVEVEDWARLSMRRKVSRAVKPTSAFFTAASKDAEKVLFRTETKMQYLVVILIPVR